MAKTNEGPVAYAVGNELAKVNGQWADGQSMSTALTRVSQAGGGPPIVLTQETALELSRRTGLPVQQANGRYDITLKPNWLDPELVKFVASLVMKQNKGGDWEPTNITKAIYGYYESAARWVSGDSQEPRRDVIDLHPIERGGVPVRDTRPQNDSCGYQDGAISAIYARTFPDRSRCLTTLNSIESAIGDALIAALGGLTATEAHILLHNILDDAQARRGLVDHVVLRKKTCGHNGDTVRRRLLAAGDQS